jgi:23S rRNA pseudouridine955/2504/2580 synthase
MSKQKFKVASQESGMTLLAFLRDHCPDAPSVKALQRWIEGKRCKVNGRLENFSTHRLKNGDEIILEINVAEEKTVLKPLLLWEDESLRAYDKPAGLICQPNHFKGKLVHRLDKETSGVLLVAKSQKILNQMIELFRQKKVRKTYLAVVDGVLKQEKGKIVTRLAPKRRYQGQTIYGSGPKGQWAETEWKKVKEGSQATLLECHPITGRTHQLRVHLKELHHPILGDSQYGDHFQCNYPARRHLLHAYEVSFPHPLSGESLTLRAPLPSDFIEALEALGLKGLNCYN